MQRFIDLINKDGAQTPLSGAQLAGVWAAYCVLGGDATGTEAALLDLDEAGAEFDELVAYLTARVLVEALSP